MNDHPANTKPAERSNTCVLLRRLYFYLVAFISLEVVMWSIITLARTLFDAATLNNIGDQIAGGLAFLIVGLPIFLFHWFFIQRDSAQDAEERSSRLREIFLYGIFLATLIPIAQNMIALINRVTIQTYSSWIIPLPFWDQNRL